MRYWTNGSCNNAPTQFSCAVIILFCESQKSASCCLISSCFRCSIWRMEPFSSSFSSISSPIARKECWIIFVFCQIKDSIMKTRRGEKKEKKWGAFAPQSRALINMNICCLPLHISYTLCFFSFSLSDLENDLSKKQKRRTKTHK